MNQRPGSGHMVGLVLAGSGHFWGYFLACFMEHNIIYNVFGILYRIFMGENIR